MISPSELSNLKAGDCVVVKLDALAVDDVKELRSMIISRDQIISIQRQDEGIADSVKGYGKQFVGDVVNLIPNVYDKPNPDLLL